MRALRVVLAAVIALVAAAALSAWLVPQFLDWDHFRGTVERVASTQLGRPVRIEGPIRLALLPQVILTADHVTLADTGDGASATAAQIRLRLALGALVAGRIEPQDLVLDRPSMHLPWPLTTLQFRTGSAPASLHARIEDGALWIGGLGVSGIEGEFGIDPATGTLSASGLGDTLGHPWRMTARLGRSGSDGSSPLQVSVDGQGPGIGTGGALSGQIAPDGNLAGRISGRGPDLSLLLPAPALPWRADGRIVAGSGLLVADDLELDIANAPARGAVALRLLPEIRLDAALATSRLDLDAWLKPLLQGVRTAVPTGIDLSAEAATLAGGTLRRVRAGFELTATGAQVRELEAVLPGDAALAVSGALAGGRFSGAARLDAADVAPTLAWLRPALPGLLAPLPQRALHAVSLSASVTADGTGLSLGSVQGKADGVAIEGDLALHAGTRPAITAKLQLTGPALEGWLPPPLGLRDGSIQLEIMRSTFAGFDADVAVKATNPLWRGQVLTGLDLSLLAKDGVVEVPHASLTGPGLSLTVSGSLAPGGRIGDGRINVSLAQTEPLGASLPAQWQFAAGLFHGPGKLAATASGPPGKLAINLMAELSDARAQATGLFDLPAQRWTGAASLHHPGAPRLLQALAPQGIADPASWLGDGSLSIQTDVKAAPDRVALTNLGVSAGLLHMSGDLALSHSGDGRPMLTGSLDADTLPVPLPSPRSSTPWSLSPLEGFDAQVTVHAAHLLWALAPVGDAAGAKVSLSGGKLHVDDFTGQVGGGHFSGRLALDAATPPAATVSGTLTGAVLDGPLFNSPLDLVAGSADVAVDLSGQGYSPAGLLAKLAGSVSMTVRDGALAGIDGGRLLAVLQAGQTAAPSASQASVQADMRAALLNGATPFRSLQITAQVLDGIAGLRLGELTAPSGPISVGGSIDLPGDAVDLTLLVHPAVESTGPPPSIGLRVIGPVVTASRTPELASVTQWMAGR